MAGVQQLTSYKRETYRTGMLLINRIKVYMSLVQAPEENTGFSDNLIGDTIESSAKIRTLAATPLQISTAVSVPYEAFLETADNSPF